MSQAQKDALKDRENYLAVVTKRAEKIVATLEINDSAKLLRVTNLVAMQYVNLNDIHTAHENKIEGAKQNPSVNKENSDKIIKSFSDETALRLDSLHSIYLTRLSTELNNQQVEKVKDGMTYSVLPITYKGYQDMLPELTTQQKAKILLLLTEAREKAMDAGSSEEKHKWFGKYKGKINNYLAGEGYNLKKASEEWQARIKAAEKSN
jgi:hypothetical protein